MTTPAQIHQAHQFYCRMTGQSLRLDYVRERQWYELLRQGFTLEDLRRVIIYLQREIRQGRRNVGALKLSNLLQPDRFEEDLNIRNVRLKPPPPLQPPSIESTPMPTPLSPQELEQKRRQAIARLRQLKENLSRSISPHNPTPKTSSPSTNHPGNHEASPTNNFENISTK